MNSIKTLLLLLATATILTSLAGCLTIEEQTNMLNSEMAQWKGKSVPALVGQMGPPTRTMSDGKGGTIYVYDKSTSYQTAATSTPVYDNNGNVMWYQNNPGSTNVTERYRTFFINQSGTIYDATWKGL